MIDTFRHMKRHIDLPQVPEVKLPIVFGLKPGSYIAILLTITILIAIFLVCYLPGIIKGGRYVTFTSPLAQSGVQLDKTYLGGTPYQYFVKSGTHSVSFIKGGVTLETVDLTVDHPVFLTWLFHRTATLSATLSHVDTNDQHAINTFNLEEVVAISAITEFDAIHPYPPVFQNLVQDALALNLDETLLCDTLELAVQYITSETMLLDAQRAVELLPSVSAFTQETLALAENLFKGTTTQEIGRESSFESLATQQSVLRAGEFIQNGITFPATSLTMGKRVPLIFPETLVAGVEVTTPSFTLASTPVSQYQWALFIEENPQWDKGQLQYLVQQGLTDEFYLSGIIPSVVFATGKPVHNISYQAAEAFCSWLTEKTGKRVFLPTEAMWTVAALQASHKPYTKSLTITDQDTRTPLAMLGGVWEFTQSPFIPLQRITDYEKVAQLEQRTTLTTDVIVKGGSYLNNPLHINEYTVGAVDTTSCGDLIGFRIAWTE